MTVCTNDLALGNLVQKHLPTTVSHAMRDVEQLLTQMIEFEDHGVSLATIAARVHLEELEQVAVAFVRLRSSPLAGCIDVAPTIA
jgi:hypothetical protein